MRQYHPKHRALIVMDDTSRQLNRAVAMKHASFQRAGNRNMTFPAIVEYPFFTRSELSNGVQLADLLAYSVYRAFKDEDLGYPYFERVLGNFYRRRQGTALLITYEPHAPDSTTSREPASSSQCVVRSVRTASATVARSPRTNSRGKSNYMRFVRSRVQSSPSRCVRGMRNV